MEGQALALAVCMSLSTGSVYYPSSYLPVHFLLTL